MSSQNTAQGSFTIKRIRTGQTLGLYFNLGGKQLGQVYNITDGRCTPDWTVAANQVTITPVVEVISGGASKPTINAPIWKYQGIQLIFGADGISTNFGGAFKIANSTNALTIIKNLASADNMTNDTLEFSCEANLDGIGYNIAKTADIILQGGGADSAIVSIDSENGNYLNDNNPTTTLKVLVTRNGVIQGNDKFYVRWYKQSGGGLVKVGADNSKTLAVTRAMVDGVTIFKADISEDNSSDVYGSATITLTDGSDDYTVLLSAQGDNSVISEGRNVTVKAQLMNQKTNAVETKSGMTWKMGKYDPQTLRLIDGSEVSTNTLTVTAADSDKTAAKGDVIVMAEATWNE